MCHKYRFNDPKPFVMSSASAPARKRSKDLCPAAEGHQSLVPATKCSDWDQIEKFSEIVFNAGDASALRTPRGRDIFAACGRLKSASETLSVSRQKTRTSPWPSSLPRSSPPPPPPPLVRTDKSRIRGCVFDKRNIVFAADLLGFTGGFERPDMEWWIR